MRLGLTLLALSLLLAGPVWAADDPGAPAGSQTELDGRSANEVAVPPSDPVPLSPPPREVQFAQDIPAEEIGLGDYFDPTNSYDHYVSVFGNPSGELVALVREDFQLQAIYSGNSGVTWDDEVVVAGGRGIGGNYASRFWFDGNSTIHAVIDFADPDGACGLQFTKSTDMGRTWSTPLELVSHGDDTHGITMPRIGANAAGRIAVLYVDRWSGDPYVRVSSDAGSSWTPRVRLDPGVTEGTHYVYDPWVAVDGAGIVHAVWAQNRTATYNTTDTNTEIFYTRSTDGGSTFESEISLSTILPSGERWGSRYPHMVTAADDSLLIAFWDEYTVDRLYVVRSTDGGQNFQLVLQQDLSSGDSPRSPYLFPSPDDGTVLVGVHHNWMLKLWRSANHGAVFGSPQVVASTAYGFFEQGLVRTPSGQWVVAWSDRRHDSYVNWMRDVYVRVSTNDGLTWGVEQRANSNAAGSSTIGYVRLAPLGNSRFAVAFTDCREANGADCDVYANRASAQMLLFGSDQRIDHDRDTRSIYHYNGVQIASDGAGHVYAAIPVIYNGPYKDIFVVRSDDGAYTFQPALRASRTVEGQSLLGGPQIAATSDGYVYMVYKHRPTPVSARAIRINVSSDYGASWPANDDLLGYGIDSSDFAGHSELDLAALPGGRAWVVWSDGVNVYFSRTTDGGATFSAAVDIDQAVSGNQNQPDICAQGSQVTVVFKGNSTIWAVISDDGGQTWGTRLDLRQAAGDAAQPTIDCDGAGKLVATWTDNRNGVYEIFAARHDGGWQTSQRVGDAIPVWSGQFYPVVAYASPSRVLITYHEYASTWNDLDLSVFAVASMDAGQSFGTPFRLDGGLRDGTRSVEPHVVGDGLGNAWVSWREYTAWEVSIAARHSSDGGQTWSEVHRVNRELPQGYYDNDTSYSAGNRYVAADPGVGYFIWGGLRDTAWREAIVQAWDLDDFDRDGSATGVDCNDGDPGAFAVPVTVGTVDVERLPTTTRLTWPEQATTAGPGTRYDVVSGDLSALLSAGDYAAASCMQNDLAEATADDSRPGPGSGQGFYYLIRAENSCGAASYGDSSLPTDPRDVLDAGSPCP